jgi:hypothetical protein
MKSKWTDYIISGNMETKLSVSGTSRTRKTITQLIRSLQGPNGLFNMVAISTILKMMMFSKSKETFVYLP